MQENRLTEGSVNSSLLEFTIPFLFSNLLQTLYGTVDTLIVGNFGSTEGLSAVSTGAQVLSMLTFLAIGLSNGATVLLGQYVGAKDDKRCASVVGNTIISFTVVSLVCTILMLMIYPLALNLLNTPIEALPEAYRYMKICSFGIPLIIGYNIVCSLLRAMGDSKSPLLFVFVACLVNIAGDALLTGYFHMGASGVAFATVGAQGISFIFSLVFIMRRGMNFPFTKNDIRFSSKMTKQIFKIGIPMGLQSILINVSFMFITSIINAMGLSASAAMGIGDKITGFAFMPQSAFSASLSVFVAQNIGAKQPKRVLSALKFALICCLVVEIPFLILCLVRPNFCPALFTSDEEVIVMAGLYMKAYSLDAVLTSISFCLSGLLNGCGKTSFNMVQNLISTFLGRIPATFFLSRLVNTNLFLIGMAAPASTLMTIVMVGYYIYKGYWKPENI